MLPCFLTEKMFGKNRAVCHFLIDIAHGAWYNYRKSGKTGRLIAKALLILLHAAAAALNYSCKIKAAPIFVGALSFWKALAARPLYHLGFAGIE